MADLPTVYLTSFQWLPPGDFLGVALADDGEVLAEEQTCSARSFRSALHDAGHRHDVYARKYGAWGDGSRYRLVECLWAEVPAEVIARAEAWKAEQEANPTNRSG